jgi:hypothetical protein
MRGAWIGLQWQNFASAGAAGMISFLAAMVADLLRGHDIRWSRHAGSLFVTSFGALTGGWVGSQTASALLVTPLGQRLLSMVPVRAIGVAGAAGALGGAVGGVVVTALVSYLMAIFGLSDWKTAHREMVAGSAGSLAGAGAAAGTFFGVAAWGTASTGTAIGSLSGAAATNAALAAIGGGSMAVGSAILTGGAALVMLAVAGGVRLIFSHMDARARHLFLVGRIEIVRDLVGRGKQPEWVMA